MSVLIKGMEMPKNCATCFIEESECKALANAEHLYVWAPNCPNCPLIEIPPHGDLIDRDALINDCKKYLSTLNPDRDGKECARIHWLIGVLQTAQHVIIPAEGSTI